MIFTTDDFETLSDLIYRKAGIRYDPKRIYYLSKRVEKRMTEIGIDDAADYSRHLRFNDKNGLEFQNLVNLLTVNETYFFRDFVQLQSFGEHCLKDMREKKKAASKQKTLRIWSAACSSGEEPYTIAIILLEMLEDISEWKVEIIANDIDVNILAKARQGTFDERSLRDVPEEYLEKYFENQNDGHYRLVDRARQMVSFVHLNLADKTALRELRSFDFVFCRNLLIYFDDVSRKELVDHFYVALNPGGYIFLGSSESVTRISSAFKVKSMGKHLVYYRD